jgi:PBSX family phage terminase large subunit
MSNEVKISDKFEPLFRLLDDTYHPEIDTVIITGGRYSLKSYSVSIFSLLALTDYQWDVLYTRYTNESITDSVKPEVSDKAELLGKVVNDTNTHIEKGSNRIAFKGIKTGSKQQTANLKSLSGFNLFVNDEAEELPDYKTFKKIFYSIRSTSKRNLNILILNPTTKDHWIFQEFFEKKGLEGGENCIVDNVMYIHSSYLDCDFSIMPKNILADYQRLKEENPDEYENIVMGGWITEPEGILLPKSKLKFATFPPEKALYRFAVGDPSNKGGDKFPVMFCEIYQIESKVICFVRDVIHSVDGVDATVNRTAEKLEFYKSEQIFYESNGLGLSAVLLQQKNKPAFCAVVPFNSTEEKDVRILSFYEFVASRFYFGENYKSNKEYSAFISDLTSYSRESDNKHKKDAIDCACQAAKIMKLKYKL